MAAKPVRSQLLGAVCAASMSIPAAMAAPISLSDLKLAIPKIEQSLENLFVDRYVTSIRDIVVADNIVVVPDKGGHLNVDNQSKQEALLGGNVFEVDASFPVVNVYIVDDVRYCGRYNTGLAACADQPGRHLYFEGRELRENRGDELFAHELAHALGLVGHVKGRNLMNAVIRNGVSTLDRDQLDLISRSPLIQNGQLRLQFILIEPAPALSTTAQ